MIRHRRHCALAVPELDALAWARIADHPNASHSHPLSGCSIHGPSVLRVQALIAMHHPKYGGSPSILSPPSGVRSHAVTSPDQCLHVSHVCFAGRSNLNTHHHTPRLRFAATQGPGPGGASLATRIPTFPHHVTHQSCLSWHPGRHQRHGVLSDSRVGCGFMRRMRIMCHIQSEASPPDRRETRGCAPTPRQRKACLPASTSPRRSSLRTRQRDCEVFECLVQCGS